MLSDDRPSYERIARQVFVLSFALFLHQLQNLANSGCPLKISPWLHVAQKLDSMDASHSRFEKNE